MDPRTVMASPVAELGSDRAGRISFAPARVPGFSGGRGTLAERFRRLIGEHSIDRAVTVWVERRAVASIGKRIIEWYRSCGYGVLALAAFAVPVIVRQQDSFFLDHAGPPPAV